MHFEPWHIIRNTSAAVLATALAVPMSLQAQATQHLVSPSDLQKATEDASQTRQQNLDSLKGFLSSAQAQQAMHSAHVNPQEVNKAVAGLSDVELAQLASRANKAQADFAAGNIDNHDLLVILVAIVVLILIIVAVH